MTYSPLSRRPARRSRYRRCALRLVLIALCVLVTVAIPDPVRADAARWQWPLPAPHEVVRDFEPPEHPYGPGHRGVDIAAAAGQAVRSVEAGTVRFSGTVAGRGVVSVRHADGLISTYEPVSGSVAEGRPVAAGDVIGTLAEGGGSGHCRRQPCLHLGARVGQGYRDPMLLLGARGPSVLLPQTGLGSREVAGAAVPASGPAGATAASGPVTTAASRPVVVRTTSPVAARTAGGPISLLD